MPINLKLDTYTGSTDFSNFPFELSDFQKHSLDAIDQGHNVLVTAPTGCGKTLVAEYTFKKYCSHNLEPEKRKKVLYTSPIKALSNCLFNEFTKKFPNINFGILTGDIKFNPNADCIIMTTEILRNLLYNKKIKTNKLELSIEIDVYNDVGAIIFDEVHYIGDKGRGRVWEESLILLPPKIQLVMLSATIDKPEIFGQWLQDIKNIPLTLASAFKRVVPLKHYVYTAFLDKFSKVEKNNKDDAMTNKFDNQLVQLMDTNNKFDSIVYDEICHLKKKYKQYMSNLSILNNLTLFLHKRNLLPSIMFTLSRKKCEEYAKNINIVLNTPQERSIALKIFHNQLYKITNHKDIMEMPEYFIFKDLISKGVAYHHSGVYHIFKEIIEILLAYKNVEGKNQPLIKLLFATETFAVGINMPTKAVCYTGITKYSENGFRLLEPHEYKQMSGRAGRRGIDKEGIAILIPNLYDLPTSYQMRNMMSGKNQHIESKFMPNFQFLLKLILTGNNQIMKFIKNSLLNTEITKTSNAIQFQLDDIQIPDLEKYAECIKYDNLLRTHRENSIIKISNKMFKKNKKLAGAIKRKPDFAAKYTEYSKFKNSIEKKKTLESNLQSNNYYIHKSIIQILEFLQREDYISSTTNIQEYDSIQPSDIHIKGVIASQINECNELYFTEIMSSGLLDSLDEIHLATVLSIFLDVKTPNDQQTRLCDLEISVDTRSIIGKIMDLSDDLYNKVANQHMTLDLKWNLSLERVMPTYEWINGGNLTDITRKYDIYSGNFVKEMIKLNNIVQDVVKTASVLEKPILMETASKIEELLIRKNVNMDSLYIR